MCPASEAYVRFLAGGRNLVHFVDLDRTEVHVIPTARAADKTLGLRSLDPEQYCPGATLLLYRTHV